MVTLSEVSDVVESAIRQVGGLPAMNPIFPSDKLAGAKLRIISDQQNQAVAGIIVKKYPKIKLLGPTVKAAGLEGILLAQVWSLVDAAYNGPSAGSLSADANTAAALAPAIDRVSQAMSTKFGVDLTAKEKKGLAGAVHAHLGGVLQARIASKTNGLPPGNVLLAAHLSSKKTGRK